MICSVEPKIPLCAASQMLQCHECPVGAHTNESRMMMTKLVLSVGIDGSREAESDGELADQFKTF